MISGVAVTSINTVVLAAAYPMYLHFLGYEQYGVWLVLSTVLTFAQLGNLGMGQAVTKLVAEQYGRGDLEAALQYLTSATIILLASGAIMLALIILFKGHIVALFKLHEGNARTVSWLLPYMACLTVYVFVVQAVNAVLSGLNRMDLANYTQTGGRFIAVLVASVLLSQGAGVEGLLIASAMSYFFIHATSLVCIRRVAPVRILRIDNLSIPCIRRLLTFGFGMLGSSILAMLLSPFNRLMLSRYSGVASIPVYEIAYMGSMQVRAFAEAGIRALMPEVSRLGANMTEQASTRIRDINRRCVRMVIYFALPLYMILIFGASLLLRVWLGSRFTASLPMAFRVALVSSFLSLACVPAYYMLLGLGRVRHCFMNQAILAGTNVLLVLAFAWVDKELSLIEVIASVLIGTGVSSTYTILQGRRTLHHVPCDQTVG